MANWWRSLSGALWTLDRALGGQKRPTRLQKWMARHPIGAGLCGAVPFTLFFLGVSREGEPDDLMFAAVFGLALGVGFALTAVAERYRQRRLKRLGIWDG